MSDTEGSSTSQGELSRSFSMLPERQAKVATLVSMMEKSPKASVKGHGDGKKDKEFKGHGDGKKDKEFKGHGDGKKDKEVKKEIKDEVKDVPEDPELFCICRTTDSTSFMICCDFCEEWFHGRCVNIEQETSKNIKRYACPPCQAKDPIKHTILYKEKKQKIEPRRDIEKERERLKDRHKDKKKKKKKKLSKEKMKKKKKKMKPSHKKNRGEGGSRYVHRSARRCGACDACMKKMDCGKCDFCLDMKKFGGPNKIRQKCRLKQCIKLSHLVKRGYRRSDSSPGTPGTPGTPGMTDSERGLAIYESTTSFDTDTDRLLKILSKSKKPSKSITSKLKDFKKRTGLGVPLIDHYDYSKKPEEDPEYIKKMEEEKRLREEKKERERQERETLKQLRLEERRRSSRLNDKSDEDSKRRKLDDAKAQKQCSGPACVNAARSGSKYCSDDCGMKLATTRIFEFLPQRIQQWQQSPCIAEENNKKQLEEMRRQMEEAKRKIAELDKKIVQLRQIIERAKKIPIAENQETSDGDSEEAELSIYCVSCGHPVNPTRALRHMSKCYSKYETQTSYGSAFKTRIVGESMFCDFFNASQNTYCKRLKVLCPEHTKEPKIPEKEVCGCPLIADVFKETKAYCQVAKRKCYKHHNWEKLRRAEIDLERVRWWLKLDDLLEQERNIRMSMSTRAGVLGLMLHQTIDHTLLMPPPVMPAQPMQGTPAEQSNGVKQETAVAEAQQNGQMQQLPVSTAQQNRQVSQSLTPNTATPVTASA